ncbi:hypothetical protein A5875_002999 [Enterococcus sp. 3H8_DIV0648]|nr:hypothetical protein A5875_002999 [Enterococcus sp. 3H8_DIV0648]
MPRYPRMSRCLEPVSYTHLDVYKRQRYPRMSRCLEHLSGPA